MLGGSIIIQWRGVDKLYSQIIHSTVDTVRVLRESESSYSRGKYGAINQLHQLISSFLKTPVSAHTVMVPCYKAC